MYRSSVMTTVAKTTDAAHEVWEIVTDLGRRVVTPGRFKTAQLYRCRCRKCGSVRLMTASELSAAKCNEYKKCRNCPK